MANVTSVLPDLVEAHMKDGVVDVVSLANALGLEVYPVELPDAESGYIEHLTNTDDSYIVVNKNHPSTRQRFTVAHEIGHFFEHKTELLENGRLDRKNGSTCDPI